MDSCTAYAWSKSRGFFRDHVIRDLIMTLAGILVGVPVGARVGSRLGLSPIVSAVLGVSVLAFLIFLAVFVVNLVRAPYVSARESKEKLKKLEEAIAMSSPLFSLEPMFSESCGYLVVCNSGAQATALARIAVIQGMTRIPRHDVFARWDHTESVYALIPKGGSCRLRIARLEMREIGMEICGQWFIQYTSDGKAAEAAASSSFMYGIDHKDTVDLSAITLEVVLFADPALLDGPIRTQIALVGGRFTTVPVQGSSPIRSSTVHG